MNYLLTFKGTASVLQAEQILIRRNIPFETVPHSHFNQSGCGLAILFSEKHVEDLRRALDEVHLKGNFMRINHEAPP